MNEKNNVKILYFINISVKYIFWQILNEIVENQDLNRNKEKILIF